jgi:hypothetical protein
VADRVALWETLALGLCLVFVIGLVAYFVFVLIRDCL